MKRYMKYMIYAIVVIVFVPLSANGDPNYIGSNQLAPNPVAPNSMNGYMLVTNGVDNAWVAISGITDLQGAYDNSPSGKLIVIENGEPVQIKPDIGDPDQVVLSLQKGFINFDSNSGISFDSNHIWNSGGLRLNQTNDNFDFVWEDTNGDTIIADATAHVVSVTTDEGLFVENDIHANGIIQSGDATHGGTLELNDGNGVALTISNAPMAAPAELRLASLGNVPVDDYLVAWNEISSGVWEFDTIDPSTIGAVSPETFHWGIPSGIFGALPPDPLFNGTGEQGFGGAKIATRSGTITTYGYYFSNWVIAGTADVITIYLKINGATADSFTAGDAGTTGWKSTSCSEAVSAGDRVNVTIEKTIINLPEDNVSLSGASAG